MVLVQVKRNHGRVLRRHISRNGIPKHLQSLKDEISKGIVIKTSFCPQAPGVNDVLGLKCIQ